MDRASEVSLRIDLARPLGEGAARTQLFRLLGFRSEGPGACGIGFYGITEGRATRVVRWLEEHRDALHEPRLGHITTGLEREQWGRTGATSRGVLFGHVVEGGAENELGYVPDGGESVVILEGRGRCAVRDRVGARLRRPGEPLEPVRGCGQILRGWGTWTCPVSGSILDPNPFATSRFLGLWVERRGAPTVEGAVTDDALHAVPAVGLREPVALAPIVLGPALADEIRRLGAHVAPLFAGDDWPVVLARAVLETLGV